LSVNALIVDTWDSTELSKDSSVADSSSPENISKGTDIRQPVSKTQTATVINTEALNGIRGRQLHMPWRSGQASPGSPWEVMPVDACSLKFGVDATVVLWKSPPLGDVLLTSL
jgi:hypothetical protein